MSARTDLADDVVYAFAAAFVRSTDPDERARRFDLARAAVRAWRGVYAREARLSRMRSAYRRRRNR